MYINHGPWYSQNLDEHDQPWNFEKAFRLFKGTYLNQTEAFKYEGWEDADMYTDPMDPIEGVGNQVFYVAPMRPVYTGTKKSKIQDIVRRREWMTEQRKWLHEQEADASMKFIWAIEPMAEGQNHSIYDPKGTGMHVNDDINEIKASLLLNLRCNAKLDRQKSYPYERTCCTDYGVKPLVQLGAVAAAILYLVACVIFSTYDLCTGREEPTMSLLDMKPGMFAMALLMCYYSDRTQFMAKGAKVWLLTDFAVLCAICIVIGLVTIRRSRSKPKGGYKEISSEAMEPMDEPFLSRDQTDEWKGWMQFIILIYHWTNASIPAVYTVVRVLVAAYLFQTGYGHTLFYLNKKDFGFNRAASVLLRLNLLSCSLAYVMDTDYMLYYFSPLVSFWYLVVYTTMAVGHERFNGNIQLVIAKICISAMIVSVVTLVTPFLSWFFWAIELIFKIQWDYDEWYYRVTLDIFIVYIGMLIAVATTQIQNKIQLGLRVTLAATGFVVMGQYFWNSAHMDIPAYKKLHPYMAYVPILGFIALRNVSGPVRNFHSKAMAWLGRCSLETYTLQFHILLAADTQGVLVVDGFFGDGTVIGDRWRTLIIIVPIFLWISSATATATNSLVKAIMKMPPPTIEETIQNRFLRTLSQWITPPKLKIAGILLVMWLLNIMSPSHFEGPAPDGYTPHKAGSAGHGGGPHTPGAPMATPTPH